MIKGSAHLRELNRLIFHNPVVALLGARQVGKTTLAREVARSRKTPAHFFDIESTADLLRLADPMLALTSLRSPAKPQIGRLRNRKSDAKYSSRCHSSFCLFQRAGSNSRSFAASTAPPVIRTQAKAMRQSARPTPDATRISVESSGAE